MWVGGLTASALDREQYYKKGMHKAIKNELNEKDNYVVEADINGFFNNINHEWLIRMLKERINDGAFIGLIKK